MYVCFLLFYSLYTLFIACKINVKLHSFFKLYIKTNVKCLKVEKREYNAIVMSAD